MNTTKRIFFVLVLVTMLTGFFPGSALAAPSGKRRPAGWYHHILGNGNCKDKNWQPYGPPVKNKEWKKGQCPVTTPAPSPVPTTPGPNQNRHCTKSLFREADRHDQNHLHRLSKFGACLQSWNDQLCVAHTSQPKYLEDRQDISKQVSCRGYALCGHTPRTWEMVTLWFRSPWDS